MFLVAAWQQIFSVVSFPPIPTKVSTSANQDDIQKKRHPNWTSWKCCPWIPQFSCSLHETVSPRSKWSTSRGQWKAHLWSNTTFRNKDFSLLAPLKIIGIEHSLASTVYEAWIFTISILCNHPCLYKGHYIRAQIMWYHMMTSDRTCLDIRLPFVTHNSFQQCSGFAEPVQLLSFGANPTRSLQGLYGCTAPLWPVKTGWVSGLSQPASTTQPVAPPSPPWDGEENRKKVKPAGWEINNFII